MLQVVVEDETNKQRFSYPCDRWFDKSEEDGLIRRRLKVRALVCLFDTMRHGLMLACTAEHGACTKLYVILLICESAAYSPVYQHPGRS